MQGFSLKPSSGVRGNFILMDRVEGKVRPFEYFLKSAMEDTPKMKSGKPATDEDRRKFAEFLFELEQAFARQDIANEAHRQECLVDLPKRIAKYKRDKKGKTGDLLIGFEYIIEIQEKQLEKHRDKKNRARPTKKPKISQSAIRELNAYIDGL